MDIQELSMRERLDKELDAHVVGVAYLSQAELDYLQMYGEEMRDPFEVESEFLEEAVDSRTAHIKAAMDKAVNVLQEALDAIP